MSPNVNTNANAKLFEDDRTSATPEPEVLAEVDYLSELVGDGKKFKTPAELAKGKAESDAFIARLLEEAKELRGELQGRKNLEELAADLAKKQTPQPSASNDSEPKNRERDSQDKTKPEDIEAIVDSRLTQRELQNRVANNLAIVKGVLDKTLGENSLQKARQRARKVDPTLSNEDLDRLASRNPDSFFKLLDINTEAVSVKETFQPPNSTVNTSALPSTMGGERTRSYYNKLKATDSVKYFSSAMRKQQYDDAMRLGEKFEDV